MGFLSNQLGQTLAIFNISPIIMGEMLILTLGFVLLASFLPVKRVSSMKPIDAIKNK
jgi:ABC-type antimicrobial peptide transport system permease subunit